MVGDVGHAAPSRGAAPLTGEVDAASFATIDSSQDVRRPVVAGMQRTADGKSAAIELRRGWRRRDKEQ